MVGQKGSVLVGILGVSIALSIAAASLMLVAANSRNGEDTEFARQQVFNDAESGLLIGAGWLRKGATSKTFIGAYRNWTNDSLILQSDAPYDNGSLVTVVILDHAPIVPPKSVISRAVKGTDTTVLKWDVDTVAGPLGTDGYPVLSLTNWQSL